MGGEQISDPLDPQDDGQTPLTHEELEGLIPSHITLRGELNEVEQANIVSAQSWAYKRNNKVLNIEFLNDLHKRMFGKVWKWAGKFRTSGKNIGVDAYKIQTELKELMDTTAYWIEHNTYEPDEIVGKISSQAGLHPSLPQRQWQASENGCRPFTKIHGAGAFHMG